MTATLTQTLRQQSLLQTDDASSRPLFYFHSSASEDDSSHKCQQFLTYDECWRLVDRHELWLVQKVRQILIQRWKSCDISSCTSASTVTANHHANNEHQKFSTADLLGNKDLLKDVVVGYLSDNSPDLLFNLLGCINLTNVSNDCPSSLEKTSLLPAMLNVRWTALEISRALSLSTDQRQADSKTQDVTSTSALPCHSNYGKVYRNNRTDERQAHNEIHITIILFGGNHKDVAREAACLINNETVTSCFKRRDHIAYALPLPSFLDEICNPHSVKKSEDSMVFQNVRPNNAGKHDHQQLNQWNCTISHENIPSKYIDLFVPVSVTDALVLFTSGTSSSQGVAKGVRLSHRSLFVQAYAKNQSPCNYSVKTVMAANTVPWFHVGGLSSVFAVILSGGCLVMSPPDSKYAKGGYSERFRPESVIEMLVPFSTQNRSNKNNDDQKSQVPHDFLVNTLVVVPAMLFSMFELITSLESDRLPKLFPEVELILVGGQSIGNGLLYKKTRQYFPNAKVVQTYACTEAGSSITFQDLGYKSDKVLDQLEIAGATCVGFPPLHIEVGIFGPLRDNSTIKYTQPIQHLPLGKMGIIGTRGSHTMLGYWNRGDPSSSRTNQTNDGWMLTNDIGYILPQNGKLYFCGRANDTIRTGGESVLATEVERIIKIHDEILDCSVFALPDEKLGESVCAAIVVKSNASGNIAAEVFEDDLWNSTLRRHCNTYNLAGFKRPRRVFRMRALPQNSSGKVLKQQIVELCLKYLELMKSRL